MKQKVRKALAISGMAIVIGATGMSAYDAAAKVETKRGITRQSTTQQDKKHRRTIPGKVTAISGDTIILQKGNKTYTVTTDTTTRYLDRKWKTIAKTDVTIGHKLRIKGTVSGRQVTAAEVRDITLPKTTETEAIK